MAKSPKKALLSWSSGKDSAYALVETQRRGDYEVVGLITTVTAESGKVCAHGVPEALLHRQLSEVGLPGRKVRLPWPCANIEYQRLMGDALLEAKAEEGIDHVIFGDLFLEDIRRYREGQLSSLGMQAVFPLFGRDTGTLAREMLDAGLLAVVVCTDLAKLPLDMTGRRFDAQWLADLPAGVDPCGENGEFHTFVTAGPMFPHPIDVHVDRVHEAEGFGYAELVPGIEP